MPVGTVATTSRIGTGSLMGAKHRIAYTRNATPKGVCSVAVRAGVVAMRDAIGRARHYTVLPLSDTYAGNVARDWFSKHRLAGLKQQVTLLRDCYERGVPKSELVAVAESLRAVIEGWYDAASRDELAAAHIAEERAEGDKDVAESRLISERSASAATEYLRTREKHIEADNALAECARAIVAEEYEKNAGR